MNRRKTEAELREWKRKRKENRRKAVGAEGDRDSHRRTECRKRTRRDGREAPAEGGGSDESAEEELRLNQKEREATEAEGTEGRGRTPNEYRTFVQSCTNTEREERRNTREFKVQQE